MTGLPWPPPEPALRCVPLEPLLWVTTGTEPEPALVPELAGTEEEPLVEVVTGLE